MAVMLTLGRSEAMFEDQFPDAPPEIPGSIVHLGPFEYVGLTYDALRVSEGDDAVTIGDFQGGLWWIKGERYPFSDIDVYAVKARYSQDPGTHIEATPGEHAKVYVNGRPLTPDESLKIAKHSPTGFSWGYNGSGPAQLALAILLLAFGEEIAVRHYQDFKAQHVASWPFDKSVDVWINLDAWLDENLAQRREWHKEWS